MQAARGASLTPGDDPDDGRAPEHQAFHDQPNHVGPNHERPNHERPRSAVRLFAAVVAIVVIVDQVTKIAAVRYLQDRDPVEVIPGLIDLRFLRNPGAALGTGSSMTIVLTAVAIIVSLVVLRMATRLRDRGWAVGLGLLLGGAVGNLIDRIVREPAIFKGHVVDFIDYGPFVGNVADIALTFAAVVIVWRSWRGIGLDGSRETS